MNEVTRILDAIGQGDAWAAAQLLPLVYDELRRLAAAQMAREKPGQTLDATALVHEAYLRSGQEISSSTIAVTSLPPRPRPCVVSWSRTPAASAVSNGVATASASISIWSNRSRWSGARRSWRSTRH